MGVLLVADAGVPIPFPTDLLLIVLGERPASGVIRLWVAVLAVEVIAVVSTPVLFHVCRGPGYRLVTRSPALAGSTIFLQVHVVLGYLVGAGARELVARAAAPVLVVIASVAAVAAIDVWGPVPSPPARGQGDR